MDVISSLFSKLSGIAWDVTVGTALHVPLLFQLLFPVPMAASPELVLLPQPASTTVQSPKKAPHVPIFGSSTPVRIGEFTTVINCKDYMPYNIEISKGASTSTVDVFGAIGGGAQDCLPAESQDVNFDGHPDILFPSGGGTGGSAYSYPLYDPHTSTFSCTDEYDCGLMNPSFDVSTHTVTSISPRGAAEVRIIVYKAENGKLIKISEKTEQIHE